MYTEQAIETRIGNCGLTYIDMEPTSTGQIEEACYVQCPYLKTCSLPSLKLHCINMRRHMMLRLCRQAHLYGTVASSSVEALEQ